MARYYNRGWRRSWYKRGSSYAAKRGAATFTCRIPVEDVVTFTILASDATHSYHWSDLICTCPYAKFTTNQTKIDLSRCSLMESYLYRTYTRIYDQVKINAVSVSIGLLEGVGIGGSLNALRIYTNWDRDLTFEEIAGTASPTTPEELATGSESQNQLVVNNSRQVFRRYCAARDLQERTTYHDCSYTFHQKTNTAGSPSYVMNEGYYGDDVWAPLNSGTTGTATAAITYGQSGSTGFVPALMMAVWSPSTFNANRSISVSLKVTYSVTFRMPKFGLSSSSPSAKMSDMRGDAVEDVKREAEINEEMEKEEPVLKKKKVVYEEEVLPDDEEEEMDEDSEDQTPLTQPFKSPMKKAGKKSSS